MTKKISKRQENLLKMIDKTKDDKDYQKIWERKLEELTPMIEAEIYKELNVIENKICAIREIFD